ncbi:MAG: flippase-like domain-containing protein [Cyclobacteriaceae bacterium]|nr:flippase-like domain-containing protein [Cyclobacteriaceae bacterium]
MQFSRYLTYSKSDSAYRFIPWAIKLALVAASFYYIVSKLIDGDVEISELTRQMKQPAFGWIVAATLALMLVNWWLEAKKWQMVARPFKLLSIVQAFKAIVTSVSLDAVLPFGSGAVAGKVLSLKEENRNNVLLPVVLAQGLQSFWTVVLGSFGLYQLAQLTHLSKLYTINLWQAGFIFLLGVSVVIVLRLRSKWLQALSLYSASDWLRLAGLSFLRYLVFLIQLIALAQFLSPEISLYTLLGCSTWMFFAKTIVPKPGHIGALGIRGASAIFFLNLAGYPYAGFVLATFVLWIINLAIPSLAGLFFIKELHLTTDSK